MNKISKIASEMGRLGGRARIKKLTKKQISEACRKASYARWGKKYKENICPKCKQIIK